MRTLPLRRCLAACALTPLTAAALAACGSDEDTSTADDTAPAAVEGAVTGTPEEWLRAVCGDDATVSPGDDPEARYGKHATEVYFCDGSLDGGSVETYAEAALFDADPDGLFPSRYAEGYFTYAVGQVDEDQWVVVYEDSSTRKISEPHLATLGDLGFDVVENERQG